MYDHQMAIWTKLCKCLWNELNPFDVPKIIRIHWQCIWWYNWLHICFVYFSIGQIVIVTKYGRKRFVLWIHLRFHCLLESLSKYTQFIVVKWIGCGLLFSIQIRYVTIVVFIVYSNLWFMYFDTYFLSFVLGR